MVLSPKSFFNRQKNGLEGTELITFQRGDLRGDATIKMVTDTDLTVDYAYMDDPLSEHTITIPYYNGKDINPVVEPVGHLQLLGQELNQLYQKALAKELTTEGLDRMQSNGVTFLSMQTDGVTSHQLRYTDPEHGVEIHLGTVTDDQLDVIAQYIGQHSQTDVENMARLLGGTKEAQVLDLTKQALDFSMDPSFHSKESVVNRLQEWMTGETPSLTVEDLENLEASRNFTIN